MEMREYRLRNDQFRTSVEALVDERAAARGERVVRTTTETGWTSTVYRPAHEEA